MKFIPIFTRAENCDLWSTCYPENVVDNIENDIYSILMDDRWSDDLFLYNAIKNDEDALQDNYWKGISISQIISNIKNEVDAFDYELYNAELEINTSRSLDKIFLKLHDNIYALNTFNEYYRKAKPNFNRAIIRIYGIELEDHTIIITGGTLKFKQKMIGTNFDIEIKNLNRVKNYLKQEGITDKLGLIN